MKPSTQFLKGYFIITSIFFLSIYQPVFSQNKKQNSNGRSSISQVEAAGTFQLNIKNFGAKGDGITNDVPAFEAAKQALEKKGGGILYFPSGKYMSDENGWRVFAKNITLKGDGIDKTLLLTPDNSNTTGLQMSPYRDAGWNNAPEQQYMFENETKEGDTFIRLKAGQDMSAFLPGTIFFLSAGASYYDQYYGEFNIVDKINGNTIYLKYPLCKDYSTDKSSWYGTLTAAFTPPAIHKTAVATSFRGPQKFRTPIAISLGNELYKIIAINGDQLTLENMGKGNSSETIPAGTHIYKARSIRIAPSASYNVTVEDMTIIGHPKAVVVSNSVKTVFNEVKFISQPVLKAGGIWLDGDDGRDCTISNCIAQSDSIVPSQFARSFSDIKILHSAFIQTSIDFTEFNANCEVTNCNFTLNRPAGSINCKNLSAIVTGVSTSNIYIHNNNIQTVNMVAGIASQPDIQTFPGNVLNKIRVQHNILDVKNGFSSINIIVLGNTLIEDNQITGAVSCVFGSSGASLYTDATLIPADVKLLQEHSVCIIRNNIFTGYTDGFFTRDPNNVIIEGNTINRLGEYKKGGDDYITMRGNIIFNMHLTDSSRPFLGFVLRNNTFIGWNYRENSINFNKPVNKNVDISNNRFINNTGTFKKEKDFTISLTK